MQYFLDRNLTVRRLRRIDANRTAYSATATAYAVNLQDAQPESQQLTNGQISKMYEIYVDDVLADIKVGDQCIIAGDTYNISGIEKVDFGAVPYIILKAYKDK